MQQSYTFNYLKIYIWHGISIILNLLSMFIVIPRLANNVEIYGIYVVCISANIFLTYADIGFASAGNKYAAECFAQKNLKEETKIVAFVGFVLFMFVAIFAFAVFLVALDPRLLIKNIHNETGECIASRLLLILALFSPVVIFQRVLEIIFNVRVEQFIFQRIMIAASIMKILSVFYFFHNSQYNIVGYYLFCQVINAIALFTAAIIAKIRYQYDILLFLKSFRPTKAIFIKTKSLAFGSLFLTITWILYYELDAFAIAKMLGPESVAIYSIGFTILTFLRTLFCVIFTPFFARFNHFIGLNDINGLRKLYMSIVTLTLPFVVFPILSLFMLMGSFINALVGSYYQNSVIIARLLVLCFIYSFISYPASFLIIAQEKIKILYITAAITPVVYWTGIALTIHSLGLTSFALFKFIAISLNGVIYFFITIKFLGFSPWDFAKHILSLAVIPVAFLCGALLYFGQFMPTGKSTINLITVVATGGLSSAVALSLYYLFSDHFRSYAQSLFRKCFA